MLPSAGTTQSFTVPQVALMINFYSNVAPSIYFLYYPDNIVKVFGPDKSLVDDYHCTVTFDDNRNITVNCGLNERSIFSCPINENLNNFEYKLNQFIIDDKENIIIDNSLVTRGSVTYRVTCLPQPGSLQNTNNLFKNDEKQNDSVNSIKRSKIKKILIWIFILIVAYYVISKFCCHKEEEYSDEYNSRWRVSSNNYGGETYGLRSRGW